MKRFGCELSHPQFWARQILEYGDGAAETLADLSNRLDAANVLVVGSVREVDTCNVHPRLDKVSQYSGGV